DRHQRDEPSDEHEHDPPHEVVDVQVAGGHAPRPPRHLGRAHEAGARADEEEGNQEGDERHQGRPGARRQRIGVAQGEVEGDAGAPRYTGGSRFGSPIIRGTDRCMAAKSDETHSQVVPRRRWYVTALVIVATVLAFVAIFSLWINRQALNTDNWTTTSGKLLE